MSKFSFLVLLLSVIYCSTILSDVSVRGYYRKDGTYVNPHHRSDPDGSKYNNWSSKGNVNPYTGKSGTKDAGSQEDQSTSNQQAPKTWQ